MDPNRRAVESYWRSGMIDAVTTNEDKVAPVYKLEEICYLLRSSHVSVVKELSDFILKRLDHESPVVKQKVLRLIKYSVGKSGVGFKREMQQNSAAIRQLFHYKGQLDLLKGDALNKAIRDTAQEAISAIFASDNNTPGPVKDISMRIQGFGNKNFEMQAEDKKSFLSEVVGLGSASIRHGLSTVAASHSLRNNDNGSYKSPILQESLATELDVSHRYEKEEHSRDGRGFSGFSKNMVVGPWGQDSRESTTEMTNEGSPSGHSREKSREERLLETIVSSGGVRLLPTRDALQNFLMKASKLDAVALSHALESKLQSHLWQVRMKAMCVLESILRKGNGAHSSPVSAYFGANREAVIKCLESPQASLREKANKVLSLLDSKQSTGTIGLSGKPSTIKAEIDTVVLIHDMIDTSGPGDHGMEDSSQKQMDLSIANMNMSASPLVDDLFRDSSISGISPSAKKNEEDPFASVSFHTAEDTEHDGDLFSGLSFIDRPDGNQLNMLMNNYGPNIIEAFSSNSENRGQEWTRDQNDVRDLMDGLSIMQLHQNKSSREPSKGLFLRLRVPCMRAIN